MAGIDTKWLDDAVVEYYEKDNLKVNVKDYDAYGRFVDQSGNEHDVIGDFHDGKLAVYHKLCDEKTPQHKFTCYDQFFPLERLIKQDRHKNLDKSAMFGDSN